MSSVDQGVTGGELPSMVPKHIFVLRKIETNFPPCLNSPFAVKALVPRCFFKYGHHYFVIAEPLGAANAEVTLSLVPERGPREPDLLEFAPEYYARKGLNRIRAISSTILENLHSQLQSAP
jgi:hypothetical protein